MEQSHRHVGGRKLPDQPGVAANAPEFPHGETKKKRCFDSIPIKRIKKILLSTNQSLLLLKASLKNIYIVVSVGTVI